jgi:hypothetical protein
MLACNFSPPLPPNKTGEDASINSLSTCLQAPQGPTGTCESGVEIASALNERQPKLTAFTTALLSAQIESPYDLFSTLQPEIIFPSAVSKAAPTLNFEYGA